MSTNAEAVTVMTADVAEDAMDMTENAAAEAMTTKKADAAVTARANATAAATKR